MNNTCPNPICKNPHIQKDGFYYRGDDSKSIQRYRCTSCSRKFSSSTHCETYRQKKRRLNPMIAKLLASGVSMRRCALILKLNRKTIERKFEYLARVSEKKHLRMLEELRARPVSHLQFDDLITSEHTKLKPLSVSIAVCAKSRIILDAQVSKIPAFGLLAALSRKKYGRRKSEHREGLKRLFDRILPVVSQTSLIRSDEHQLYPEFVLKYFPKARHERFKGARGCIVGQGELKRLARDPLFMLNHTCAMFRANINRLIRKTWCTTKLAMNLQKHIYIYMCFHNEVILGLKGGG